MRIGIGYIHRGIGQASTLAAGGLTEADCESAGTILDVQTGFCMAPSYGNAADIAAAAATSGVNVAAAAPPVYTSSFVPSADPTQWLATSYGVQNTAASLVNQINRINANLYANYQNAVTDAVMTNSAIPPPPTYQTFQSAWAGEGLGPAPGTVGTAPVGTPMPVYPTDTQNPISSGFAPSGLIPAPAIPIVTTPPAGQITQQQMAATTNAPPVSSALVPASMTSQPDLPVPPSGTTGSSSTPLQPVINFLTEAPIASIPNWIWIAAAGVALFVFMGKK